MRGRPLSRETIRRYVVAFCPRCHREDPLRPLAQVRRLSGYLAEIDGMVWLVRGCPDHGRIVTLYEEDAEILDYLEGWTASTREHRPDTPGNFDPVPLGYERGLPESQTQHTCVFLVDVVQGCNLRCPTCYAGAGPSLGGTTDLDEVLTALDRRLELENGRLDVLMVSGGEPTLHPELVRLLGAVLRRDVVRVLLNTNGLEIVRDDALLGFLADHRERVEVYLQFDGFRVSTHRVLRGANLREVKRRAIERLSDARVYSTLTMTAAKGINDDEIGDVVRLALETPYVGGVCIQPVFGSGRGSRIDPLDRLTNTGVLRRLGPQTGGVVTWRDLIALPCSHPHCTSVGYTFRTDEGEWRSLVSLVGHERLRANLDLVSNRIADRDLPRELRRGVAMAFLGLLSQRSSPAQPSVRVLLASLMRRGDIGLSSLVRTFGQAVRDPTRLRELAATRVKRITVKPFMDIDTMIEERLLQCCTHVATMSETQQQAVPFCAAQAWSHLGRMKLAEVAASREVGVELGPDGPIVGGEHPELVHPSGG